MASENSIRARLATVPQKIRERGFGWAITRAAQVLLSIFYRAMHSFVGFVLGLAAWVLPNIRLFSSQTMVAYYDLAVYPISYDICWFLVWTDIERRRRNLKYLHCIFLPVE